MQLKRIFTLGPLVKLFGRASKSLRQVVMVRYSHGDQGSFGKMYLDGKTLYTAELPDRGNAKNRSCIPAGTYTAKHLPKSASGKYRDVYHLQSVPGRSGILIHAGNYAGDRQLGFKTDTYGCILVGTYIGVLGDQKAILSSRKALSTLRQEMGDKDFKLTIIDIGAPHV